MPLWFKSIRDYDAGMSHRIGVCSWSLRADGPADLVRRMELCGLKAVQLAIDPIRAGRWTESETIARLNDAGISVISGMMRTVGEDYSTLETIRNTGGVRSDEHWPANLAAANADAELASRIGIKLVTFHAGFLQHDGADPLRDVMLNRLHQIACVFASHSIDIAFETGQESAATLKNVLTQLGHSSIGINFDPANMILYGMGEPVAALVQLAPWVKQIHIKDALPTKTPGTWGTETCAGKGAVNWRAFFEVVQQKRPGVNLVIEREAREERLDDIRAARELIERHLNLQERAHA